MNRLVDGVVAYFIRKWSEKTTWLGIVAGLAIHFGVALSPELQGEVADELAGLVVIAGTLYNERGKKPPTDPTAGAVVTDSGDGNQRVRNETAKTADVEPTVPVVQPRPRIDLPTATGHRPGFGPARA